MDWRNRTCLQRFIELLSGDKKKDFKREKILFSDTLSIYWGLTLGICSKSRVTAETLSDMQWIASTTSISSFICTNEPPSANVPFNTWKGNNAYHQSKIWRKGCQVVANVTQSDHLSTDPGLSYECAPNGHFGKYICAHYLQALNTFLDISNYISRLFTDSKYGVNRRSGMDLERLGHWMLEPTSHLYIVAASVRAVLGTGQYRSFRSL